MLLFPASASEPANTSPARYFKFGTTDVNGFIETESTGGVGTLGKEARKPSRLITLRRAFFSSSLLLFERLCCISNVEFIFKRCHSHMLHLFLA